MSSPNADYPLKPDLLAPIVYPAGDSALVVEFGERIDAELNKRVLALDAGLAGLAIDGIVEAVPTYRSLLVQFDPLVVSYDALKTRISDILQSLSDTSGEGSTEPAHCWHIPVRYGGAFGRDLEEVARSLSLTPREVIALHSGAEYRVYMIGFSPGYPYLGGLPPELTLPRRATPRSKVDACSVAIAGGQASIYSIEAPGGWHLLGRTPIKPFEPNRSPACLFQAGDHIRFFEISDKEWEDYQARQAHGQDITPQLLTSGHQEM